MHALSLIGQILSRWEQRHQTHSLRLYGTLTRGAVWSCMNRVHWGMTDLRRILLWGVKQGLLEKNEARRLWTLIKMIVNVVDAQTPNVVRECVQTTFTPHLNSEHKSCKKIWHDVLTQLNYSPGVSRPWQEWITEKIGL